MVESDEGSPLSLSGLLPGLLPAPCSSSRQSPGRAPLQSERKTKDVGSELSESCGSCGRLAAAAASSQHCVCSGKKGASDSGPHGAGTFCQKR